MPLEDIDSKIKKEIKKGIESLIKSKIKDCKIKEDTNLFDFVEVKSLRDALRKSYREVIFINNFTSKFPIEFSVAHPFNEIRIMHFASIYEAILEYVLEKYFKIEISDLMKVKKIKKTFQHTSFKVKVEMSIELGIIDLNLKTEIITLYDQRNHIHILKASNNRLKYTKKSVLSYCNDDSLMNFCYKIKEQILKKMSNRSANIRLQRSDLSPYLFHYTKGEDALGILKLIVSQLKLKSNKDIICFTEAPLTSSVELFKYFYQFQPTKYNTKLSPMYKPYGIGISRDYLFRNGARPLIYVTNDELELIPNELKWRSLLLDTIVGDYSWLREWRINSNEFDFSTCKDEIVIITQTVDELNEIIENINVEVEYSYEHEIRQSFPYLDYSKTRLFKGITLEDVIVKEYRNDNIIKDIIDKQTIGETID